MPRNPYRRILVVTMLLALILVPMAGARTLKSSSVSRAQGGDWIQAALRWVEDLTGLRQPGHRPNSLNSKVLDATTGSVKPSGGSCIDPGGHPSPWCSGL